MHIITKEAIETTMRTLAALDAMQASYYREKILPKIKVPHSESDSFTLASDALKEFITNAPLGNDCGVRMNSSAIICGFQLLGLDTQARQAMECSANIEDPDE